ncbi:MAG: Histidine--tRNA ligase [Parcubacteria group bacterium ADurb.Bin326]|nr:MAG: Histidine--tRNA ligase [Parcubacteria group bacterium ADurb.Bin326]
MPKVKKEENKETKTKKSRQSKKELSTITGMRDILPQDQKYWQAVIGSAQKIANDYGYGLIETPILELADVFTKGIGKQTDVVEKEMYSFIDQGGDHLVVRPEGTASVVRAYIQHGMLNQPQPVKLFYYGPMFRHEKPQSGRFRQFYQAGFEAIGEAGPALDAQMILMGYNCISDLGIDCTIQVNSIGCPSCREEYKKALTKYYKQYQKQMCDNCKLRLGKNPMRLLDCKESSCQELRANAPQILDYLDDECKKHFMKVVEYLDELNLPYELNPRIVRGLDYYNRTVFEYWSADDSEGKVAFGGGGRYDGLVQLLGGRENTPACGLSLGVDRVVAKLRDKNVELPELHQPDIFIAQLGENAKKKAMALYESLRKKFKVSQAFYKDSLKAQLETANKLKVKYTLIIGQKEVGEGTIMLRDMDGGVQEIIDYAKAESEIAKKLEKHVCDAGIEIIDDENVKSALSGKRNRAQSSLRDTDDFGDGNDFVSFSDSGKSGGAPIDDSFSDDSY